MSDAWQGGKGDKPRSVDAKKYGDNFDRIFAKKAEPNPYVYHLFLDDNRWPSATFLPDENRYLFDHSGINTWVIVRSYKEFVEFVRKNGVPTTVSFDNDLSKEHVKYYIKIGHLKEYPWKELSETGCHCALFLKEYCKEKEVPLPTYFVHSANHLARPAIRKILSE